MGLPVAAGLLLGLLADRALGDPRRGHPVAGFGRAVGALERAIHADDVLRGAGFTVVSVGLPSLATWRLQRRLGPLGLMLLTATCTWASVGGAQLDDVAGRIAGHLGDGDLEGARALLPWLVGRDPSSLGTSEVVRAVVESVAENTSDSVVGPMVWGALAGPTGVVAFRAVNTLDAMVGHRTPRHDRFGRASARADDVAGILPARLTALVTAGAAPVVGGSGSGAILTWQRDARRHPSPNAGPVEAAAAGALGVRLGGPTAYGDRIEMRGPLGTGPAPVVADIERMRRLARTVGTVCTVLCALAAVRR